MKRASAETKDTLSISALLLAEQFEVFLEKISLGPERRLISAGLENAVAYYQKHVAKRKDRTSTALPKLPLQCTSGL